MNYRATREDLFHTLSAWDEVITGRTKIHLIACGGTALTLEALKQRYQETAKYDVSEIRVLKNLNLLLKRSRERK